MKKGELTKSLRNEGWVPFESREYEVKDDDGNVVGKIGYKAAKAINEGRLFKYTPSGADEEKVFSYLRKKQNDAQRRAEQREYLRSTASSRQPWTPNTIENSLTNTGDIGRNKNNDDNVSVADELFSLAKNKSNTRAGNFKPAEVPNLHDRETVKREYNAIKANEPNDNTEYKVPINNNKQIKIKYGIKKRIDSIANQTELSSDKRAKRIDDLIERLELNDDEKKNAISYAGIKKLGIASEASGKDGILKEITQPVVKFLQGTYDAANSASRFIFKDGMKIDGDYTQAYNDAAKYYAENPDQLGNDLFNSELNGLSTPKGDYLRDVNLDKMLEIYNDTTKVSQFISDAGFRSAGQMLGDMAIASMGGVPDAIGAVKNTVGAVAAGTRAAEIASKVANISPKIKEVAGAGVAAKAANAVIGKVNSVSIGKAIGFLNPLDNPTTALMGISAAQEKYDNLKQMGYDDETAKKNALFTGYVSTITEKMGYDGTSESLYLLKNKYIAGSASASANKNTKKIIRDYLSANVSEGVEEIYNTVLERTGDVFSKVGYVDENGEIRQRKIFGNDGIFDIIDISENFLGGFVGGAVMGSVGLISNIAQHDADTVREYADTVRRQVETSNKIVREHAKAAGTENITLPDEPDWNTATIDEINEYYQKAVDAHINILSDENVIKNDEEVVRAADNVISQSDVQNDTIKDTSENTSVSAAESDPESVMHDVKENLSTGGAVRSAENTVRAVSVITDNIIGEFSKTGIDVSDIKSTIERENLRVISNLDEDIDEKFIRRYADSFALGLERNNSAVYRELSKSGGNIGQMLTDYIIRDRVPQGMKDGAALKRAADKLKEIVQSAVSYSMAAKGKVFNDENIGRKTAERILSGDFSGVSAGDETSVHLTRVGEYYEAYGADAAALARLAGVSTYYKSGDDGRILTAGVPVSWVNENISDGNTYSVERYNADGKDRIVLSKIEFEDFPEFTNDMLNEDEEMPWEKTAENDDNSADVQNEQVINDFEKAIDDIISVDDETARALAEARTAVNVLRETPKVILDNVEDTENLPVIINYTKLYLAVRGSGVIKGNYHKLGSDVAKKLPTLLSEPDAIIKLNNGRLNVLATVETEKGNNAIISVELNSTKDIGGKNRDYNVIVTFFSSNDNYVENLISQDGVTLSYEKEDLSQVNPQLHKWLATINGKSSDNISLSQDKNNVNSNISENSENDTSIDSSREELKTENVIFGNDEIEINAIPIGEELDAAALVARVGGVPVYLSGNDKLGEIVLSFDGDNVSENEIKEDIRSYFDGVMPKYAQNNNKYYSKDDELRFSISTQNSENDASFSLSEPEEETKNLIAVHNLSAKKLEGTLELGGFPMPSIAVTKDTVGHENFGDISIVFYKDTIDPKANEENKVYSADAWTPVFPPVEYEANSGKVNKIRNKYLEISRKYGYDATRALYKYSDVSNIEDKMNSVGGERNLIEDAKSDVDLMQVFLYDIGAGKVEPIEKKVVSKISDNEVQKYDYFIEKLGKDAFDELRRTPGKSPIKARIEWVNKYGEKFDNALREYLSERFGFSKEETDNVVNAETGASKSEKAIKIRNYMTNGKETVSTEYDYSATADAIKKLAAENGFESWVDRLLTGVEKSKGLYNGKDPYTNMGDRKSFSQLHYDVTLENIVKAMKIQGDGDMKNVAGFHGIKTLRAACAKTFKSIADIHNSEEKIKNLSEEEAQEINDKLGERLSNIINYIYAKKAHSQYENSLIEFDRIGEMITECCELEDKSPGNIMALFKNYRYNIDNKAANGIVQLLFDVSQMPVHIFEAKPGRVVSFDEIAFAAVPKGKYPELKRKLEGKGIKVKEYDPDVDGSRLDVLNSEPDVKFSVSRGIDADRGIRYNGDTYSNTNGKEGKESGNGNYSISENEGRNSNAHSAVKGRPLFRIGRGALGKRGREKYIQNLDREYDIERGVINKTVKAEFIREHAYNDDMREMESDLKALGFDKVGFFVGAGRLVYRPLSSCSAVIFKNSDTGRKEVYLRYDDGEYSPRQLAVHEIGHDIYNSRLGRKIKNIIENSIPFAERNAIMQQKRYKLYAEALEDPELVFEEFVCDVLGGMTDYSSTHFENLMNAFWNQDLEFINNYKVAEYTESIDAGGADADVVDSVDFGNDFSLGDDYFDIPYDEKRQLQDYIMRKNHSSHSLESVDCKEIGNNFYIWENNSKTDYTVIGMTEIDGNEDFIDMMRGAIENGTYRGAESFNAGANRIRSRKRSSTVLNADDERTTTDRSNDRISVGQSSSDKVGRFNESGRDKQAGDKTKYALNPYDNGGTVITANDVKAVQSIPRKSVNGFTSNEIQKTEGFARKYFNEMGTKSPFFRGWFGDWRANDTTTVNVANKKGAVRGITKNIDTGWDIQISGKVFNETRAHKQANNINARNYLEYMNSIVENAVLLDSYTVPRAKSKSANSAMMHSLYAIADIGNGREVIKLYVEELNDVNNDGTITRAYQLQNITKQQLSAKGSGNSLAQSFSTANTYTVSQLFNIVKRVDANFNPNNASKVVNADGTPKIMYRGDANMDFTVFDRKKTRSSNLYGRGFYFTESESNAKTYGKPYPFYLKIENPLIFGEHNISKAQLVSFLKAVAKNEDDYDIWNYGTTDINKIAASLYGKGDLEMLQDISATAIGDLVEAIELFNSVNNTNYDGIITDTETIVFDSKQIKSATDNIGTFDGSNADIRFSIGDEREYLKSPIEKISNDIESVRLQAELRQGKVFERKDVNAVRDSILNNISIGDIVGIEMTSKAAKAEMSVYINRALNAAGKQAREKHARALARYIAQNASAYDNESLLSDGGIDFEGDRATVLGFISHGIKLSEDAKAAIISTVGERSAKGYIALMSNKDALGVDSVYDELADVLPGYFPSDVLGDGNKMRRILEVYTWLNEGRQRKGSDRLIDVMDEEDAKKFVSLIYAQISEAFESGGRDSALKRERDSVREAERAKYEKYAEELSNKYDDKIAKMRKAAKNKAESAAKKKKISVKQERYNFKSLDEAISKFGRIKEGETPYREVAIPKKISESQPISRFARTLAESEVLPETAMSEFEERILDGSMSYEKVTDKDALKAAERIIKRDGFKKSLDYWDGLIANNMRIGKKEFALGQLLFNQCVTAKDTQRAMKIAVDLAHVATQAGQVVQASRLIKQMSPDAQLYSLESSVMKLQEEFDAIHKHYNNKYGDLEITINKELEQKYIMAENEEQREAIMDEILQDVADQIPSTFKDKWDSWRYLSMLFNPKTHIRNILGNLFFTLPVRIKNCIGWVMEKSIDKDKRTKAIKSSKANKDFAEKDYAKIRNDLSGGGGKYESINGVDEKRQIFKFKPLEALRKTNFYLLEAEDGIFLKHHYKNSMAQVMTARGYTGEFLSSGTAEANAALDQVRKYAFSEAQKATYRDANKLASWLNTMQRDAQKSKNAAIRSVGYLVEGAIPFKKTPLNILKRGIEYSPIGVIQGIYDMVKGIKNENFTASEAIDKLASGISGSALMALGIFLASLGFVKGDDDDDDAAERIDSVTGVQNYSLIIGGKSYTIDWMAPMSLPFFVGVNIHSLFNQDEEVSFESIFAALKKLPDPLLNLSVLSSLNDILNARHYVEEGKALAVAGQAATSYVQQAFPSVLGQVARTVDSTKHNAYYDDPENGIPSEIERFCEQMMAKTPGLSRILEPKVDMWGRLESYGDTAFGRFFGNFISPGYYKEIISTELDDELRRLNDEYDGEGSVLPSKVPKNFKYGGVEYNMTDKEHTKFAIIKGQRSFELADELIRTDEYKKKTPEEKKKSLEKCYEAARDEAKTEILKGRGVEVDTKKSKK